MRTGADGIALTPDFEKLIWCPLSSHQLFSIPTKLLIDFTVSERTLY